jgi:hypothetical protein
VLELCAPGGRETEVVTGDRETARGHEVGQEVMCVSVEGQVSAVGSTAPLVKWGIRNLSSKLSSGWPKAHVCFF